METNALNLAKCIDHSLLHPTTTVAELEAGCRWALQYDVASVCLLPYFMSRCAALLTGSSVHPSTVIGFPHGANAMTVKIAETRQAIADGCVELDLVVNLSQVLSEEWRSVRHELRSIIEIAHAEGRKVKVIFENCYLQENHKLALCEICGELQADWVKTSTGFGSGGATLADVQLMRQASPAHVQIKASGGIRDLDAALALITAGATRIGTSKSAAILDEHRRRQGLPLG